MAQDTIAGDLHVGGALTAHSITLPSGTVTNNGVAAGAAIAATKLDHQPSGVGGCVELFGPTTAIAALTKTLGAAYAAGTLVEFAAWIEVDATGADRTVTVDLHKSTALGAYATVLTSTIGFADGETVRTVKTATINTAAYVAGDIFRAVITVGGAASAQATGLTIRLIAREAAQ